MEHIKEAVAESRFTREGYRKIWAGLRVSGIRSSPGPFGTIEELRLALLDFAAWYNIHWLVARLAIERPLKSEPTSNWPWIGPHDRSSRMSLTVGTLDGQWWATSR